MLNRARFQEDMRFWQGSDGDEARSVCVLVRELESLTSIVEKERMRSWFLSSLLSETNVC